MFWKPVRAEKCFGFNIVKAREKEFSVLSRE